MSNTHMRCPICKKTPTEPINLKCEHHPCYACIQPHVTIDPQSKMETKYRVSCTACNRKTVFYDLRHLILTHSSNEDEELFVTDKYLTARQAKHQHSSIGHGRQDSDGVGMTRRGSIQSIANGQKMLPEVRCPEHNEPYKYFCCDCGQKGNHQSLLCGQCSRPHQASNHRLIGMRQAEGSIQAANIHSKQEMASKKQEIDCISTMLNQNKTTIEEHYRSIEERLHSEFKRMFASLNDRYTKLRNILRDQQQRSLRQIQQKKQKLINHRNILQTLEEIELKDLETSLKFYQTYQKYAASAMPTHLVPIQLPILPHISSSLHHLDAILEESIQFDWQKSHDTNSKKSRKNSNLEEQLSHRSTREKQNRTRLAPTELKFNLKRTVT